MSTKLATIERRTAKLIEQYQAEVAQCDRDIALSTAKMKEAQDEWRHNLYREDVKIAETKRQVYFQFTKDLEDLEDVS